MPEFRVRTIIDVWLSVDAQSEIDARTRIERITHDAELDISELHAIGEIIEVEQVGVDA